MCTLHNVWVVCILNFSSNDSSIQQLLILQFIRFKEVYRTSLLGLDREERELYTVVIRGEDSSTQTQTALTTVSIQYIP